MGASESKPASVLDYKDKKPTDIKVLPASELPKLETSKFVLPKAELIKSKHQLEAEAEAKERALLRPFSLKT